MPLVSKGDSLAILPTLALRAMGMHTALVLHKMCLTKDPRGWELSIPTISSFYFLAYTEKCFMHVDGYDGGDDSRAGSASFQKVLVLWLILECGVFRPHC